MKKYFYILLASILVLGACKKDSDFLTTEPSDIVASEAVWKDKGMIYSVLADLYNQYRDSQTIENWQGFTLFDEAFPSESGSYGITKNKEYGYASFGLWDYAYMRNLNLSIQNCNKTEALSDEEKNRYLAEARFLRAADYFEMVKLMGGVPLILEPMTYDYSGDPSYLRHARAREYEIYDFVISELDAIKTMLPDTAVTQARATKAAALAMQARAALYAASIARYGAGTPAVSLPNGEVGIPADKATAYYQKALTAAQEIINGGKYALYMKKPGDLQDNFAALFYDKSNNPEVIFAEDFKLKSGKAHGFTIDNQPLATAEETGGGRLNPSLNLALQFEKLDNTFAPFVTESGGGYAFYNSPLDLFAGRDARLGGTFILPGSQFKNKDVDMLAGILYKKDGAYSIKSGSEVRKVDSIPVPNGPRIKVVGGSGPLDGVNFTAQTGFYIRKFLDPAIGSGQIGTRSEVWWVRYRYAEVLLNAAEAAFELGLHDIAAGYMNQVRARAGLTTPLTTSHITFDRIVHERRVELAFEGHEFYDNKRWRIAHTVWNGNRVSLADIQANLGSATRANTMIYGIWPYQVYEPGSANDKKWAFKLVSLSNVTEPHWFRMGNYYSMITADIISNNPAITRNPNQ